MRTDLHVSQPLSGTAELGVKTRLLQAERARKFWRLHFRTQLENEFRDYVAQSSRGVRTGMLTAMLFLTVIAPWYGEFIVRTSPALFQSLQPFVYGQVPVLIAGAAIIWFRPLSRYSGWACVLVCMLGIASLLAQRSIASAYDYDIPLEYTGVYITVLLIILRTPFWQSLPWVIVATVAMVLNEWLIVSPPLDGYFRVVATLTLIIVSCVGGYSHEYFIRQTWINNYLLTLLSRRDSMTGLLNRKALQTTTQHMIAHAYREHCAFAIAMIDIDYFKQYNDTYGHTAGDAVIYRIANLLRNTARRPHDFCGRYGGEEFILAWTDGSYDDIYRLAQDLRERTEQAAIPHSASSVSDSVTISIGLSWIGPDEIKDLIQQPEHASPSDVEELFKTADTLLYKAKDAGRNRVVSECTKNSMLAENKLAIARSATANS